MKTSLLNSVLVASLLSLVTPSYASDTSAIVDNFDHQTVNNYGVTRQLLTDAMAGGKTTAQATFKDGTMHLLGDIAPPRGQPGWASTVLVLDTNGAAQDLSQFEGVLINIRINQGTLSLSANSTDVTNYDYHALPVLVPSDGKFHSIKLPFQDMRRTWSQQTSLNTSSIQSLSLVAFGLQPGHFDYEIDQVRFY